MARTSPFERTMCEPKVSPASRFLGLRLRSMCRRSSQSLVRGVSFVTIRPERSSKGTIDGARGEELGFLTRCETKPWSCHRKVDLLPGCPEQTAPIPNYLKGVRPSGDAHRPRKDSPLGSPPICMPFVELS